MTATTHERNSRSIHVAEVAQDLLDLDSRPQDSWLRVRELHSVLKLSTLGSIQHPEERAMRVARGCRNAALAALVHMSAVRTLGRVRDGSLVDAAVGTPDEVVQDIITTNWPDIKESELSPEEGRLLATLWKETNDDFESVAHVPPVTRPDLTRIWQAYDKRVGKTTTALLDLLENLPPEQLTKNDGNLLKWLAGGRSHVTSPYKRARATNVATVTITFNLLLGKQLDNGRLTGPALADMALADIDPAVALSGGRRDFITSVIGACPYVPGAPTTTDEAGRYNKLIPFAKRTHTYVPGDCVAYPLLTPGASDPEREDKLKLINWHRQTTNSGRLTPHYPEDYLRSSEATLRAGAAIVGALWPDSQPFRSA